jgi:hypothetical protein
MFKTICNMLAGALIVAGISAAFAVTGVAPHDGFQEIDGLWLKGLAGGQNYTYQSGITAHAGGTQAACLSITPNIYLYEVDTVATTGDSICLPFAIQGTNFSLRNAGAQTLDIYGQAANNLATGAADTINSVAGSTPYTVVTNNSMECFAAKTGSWSCVQGH